MKAMVHSPDGNTDFFDIVTGVLQRDTLAPYLFILYLDYIPQMSIDLIKENGFKLKKAKSRNYDKCKLCRRSSTSHKYTSLSRIPTA